jgi:hypothetical protein
MRRLPVLQPLSLAPVTRPATCLATCLCLLAGGCGGGCGLWFWLWSPTTRLSVAHVGVVVGVGFGVCAAPEMLEETSADGVMPGGGYSMRRQVRSPPVMQTNPE